MTSQGWQGPYDRLSKRAVEILSLLTEGLSDREIAERLVMTINTVKWYNRQIYSILGVGSRTQAIARARELQLLEAAAAAGPAPPQIPDAPRHSLPAETTRFVGRQAEIETVKRLLGATHLLTLVGPPGTGKTRLALQVAAEVADSFADGAHFVSLASVDDPALVTNTVAAAVGVDEGSDQPLIETLKHVLRQRHTLLILDNFEHLLPAATQISELLAAAPQLKVLATSREPLHLYGEQEYAVPPLALPDLARLDLQALAACESIALFVQQARAVRPDFALTPDNAADVAGICVRLEGLPLAIELAAARIKLLPPRTLLARLASRLDTLTGGAQDRPARHQTLHNTIEWSYNLLNEDEKRLFARLAVFRGTFSLDAVEAICDDGPLEQRPAHLFDGLASLVNKSLIQQQELPGGEPRFLMLETLHEYAWERLRAAGLHGETAARHSAYYLELVRGREAALYGREPRATVELIRPDLDNIRQAWQWAAGRAAADPDPAAIAGLRQAIDGLAAFYEVANLFEEGQGVFARAAGELAGAGGRESGGGRAAEGLRAAEEARCHLLARAAEFGEWRGDGEQALATATRVIELAGRLDLPRYRADAFRTLAILERERGRPEQAIGHLQEAIAIYRSLGVKRQQAMACDWCGLISSDLRRVDQAMDHLAEAAAIYAETGNERGILFNKGMTAVVLSVEGRLAESLAYQRDVLAGYQKLDYQLGLGRTCNNLGLVLLELGDFEEAVDQLERAVQVFQRAGNMAGIHNSTGNKGEVHLALDEYDEARRCFEVAGRYFHQMGMRWLDGENQWRLGWLLSNMGDYDGARAALNGCLVLAPEDENPEAFAIAHSLLAVIDWQTGDPEQAQAHFDLATEAFKAVRRQLTVARFAIIPRARLLLELGQAAAAETTLAGVWPLLDEAGRNPIVCESRLLQAKITAARGDPAGAQRQLEQILACDLRPAERAAARYELWLLTGDDEHGRAALALYRPLAARSPNLVYHQRLAALGEGVG